MGNAKKKNNLGWQKKYTSQNDLQNIKISVYIEPNKLATLWVSNFFNLIPTDKELHQSNAAYARMKLGRCQKRHKLKLENIHRYILISCTL